MIKRGPGSSSVLSFAGGVILSTTVTMPSSLHRNWNGGCMVLSTGSLFVCCAATETQKMWSLCLSVSLSSVLSIYRPSIWAYLSVYPSVQPSIYPSIYPVIYPSMLPSVCLPTDLPTYLPIYLSMHPAIYPSIFLSMCRATYLPTYQPNGLCIHPPIYLSFDVYLNIFGF